METKNLENASGSDRLTLRDVLFLIVLILISGCMIGGIVDVLDISIFATGFYWSSVGMGTLILAWTILLRGRPRYD